MAEPAMIDEPVEAGAVGLAFLLSDTHAAIIAAGDEILALSQVVAHAVGMLPKVSAPLSVEAVAEHSRNESGLAAVAYPTEPITSARREMGDVAAVTSAIPGFDAPPAWSTTAQAAGSPATPSLPLAPSVQAWVGPSGGDMPSSPLRTPLVVLEAMAPTAPTSPVDYAAYAPASHGPNFQQISVSQNPSTAHEQQPVGASVSPTMPSMRMPARSAMPAADGTTMALADRPRVANTETASSPTTMHGDVFLDGVRVGRWLSDKLARAANAPPSGSTAFDPRMGPSWPGAQQGH